MIPFRVIAALIGWFLLVAMLALISSRALWGVSVYQPQVEVAACVAVEAQSMLVMMTNGDGQACVEPLQFKGECSPPRPGSARAEFKLPAVEDGRRRYYFLLFACAEAGCGQCSGPSGPGRVEK